MKTVIRPFFTSVMNYINVSLFIIITIAMISIFSAFWISEKAENDAHAINLSGTMRMQMYKIGLSLYSAPQHTEALIAKLDKTWEDPLFFILRNELEDSALNQHFLETKNAWQNQVKPQLLAALRGDRLRHSLMPMIDQQVLATDELVDHFQLVAEGKIRELRTLQFFALIITTITGSLIFYLLRNRVELPLRNLTKAAQKISRGELDQAIPEVGDDELSDVARAFNQMNTSIKKTWTELEGKVEERTQELKRNHTIVSFLYETAQATINSSDHKIDYKELTKKLSEILGNQEIELCFFTQEGDRPYLRVQANDCAAKCGETDCETCLPGTSEALTNAISLDHHYSIEYQGLQYGVLTCHSPSKQKLAPWQDTLLKSSTSQIAISLSLQDSMNHEYRLAMLRERTVIARELHDSLAQSLSYLQIQVTRLQKAQDKGRTDIQETVMVELREGLSSAYRHLRELLTTFRLKVDEEGLEGAIDQAINQFAEQTNMSINLSYGLKAIPLTPNEEIHVLQIIREACQNAINHSNGEHLEIRLHKSDDQFVEIVVEDDGKGLPDNPEKLNHYGLAIMQERAKHLSGSISIESSETSGVKITLKFEPNYLSDAA